jgi:hypothetical protein
MAHNFKYFQIKNVKFRYSESLVFSKNRDRPFHFGPVRSGPFKPKLDKKKTNRYTDVRYFPLTSKRFKIF